MVEEGIKEIEKKGTVENEWTQVRMDRNKLNEYKERKEIRKKEKKKNV